MSDTPIYLCNEVVRELDFNAQCELASQLGYDGLELAPFTLAERPHELSATRRREVRAAADAAGLRIGALHWLLVTPQGLSITSDDPAVRSETLAVIRGLIELCAELGGTVLVHGSPQQRRLPASADDDSPAANASDANRADEAAITAARERAVEAFALAGEWAEAAGVTYCIEPLSPHEANFVNTVAEAVAIVEEVGNAHLRTMVDCRAARLAERESVPELLRRWVPRGHIHHVHLNDSNSRGPGQGADTFGDVLAALDEVGYQGAAGVEPFEYVPDGPTAAARAIGYLRGLQER